MIRRRLTLIIFALLLVGSVTGSIAVLDARGRLTRGWADPTRDFDLPYRVPLAGVNAELTQYPPEELDAQLGLMADAGVTWVRQFFPWSQIEPARGEFDWEPWDRIVEAVASARGLKLVAVLNDSPEWARGEPRGGPVESEGLPYPPPADVDDFAAFARAFAGRYGDTVDVYQIWDEPNLKSHWGGMPQPPEYAGLLCAAYDAIHAADPEDPNAGVTTTVLAAALAPTNETGPHNLNEALFLRGMYGHGARDCFDGAAGEPFGFDTGPYDRRVDKKLMNFSRLLLLREVMVDNGDGHKPLWVSAFGWNHLPAGWEGAPSIWGWVEADTQARFTAEAYARAREEWPWLGALILHHWQPAAPDDDPQWGFAVLDAAGEPGALLDAFPEAPAGATPGRYPALNPYAEYVGEWDFTEFGADMGVGEGNGFTFTFAGATDAALELRRYAYNAYFYVMVDGKPANALPKDEKGRAYIVLNSADNSHSTDLVAVARGVDPDTGHTVEVTGQASWGGQWVLGGFRVGAPPDLAGYDAALMALMATGVIGLVGVFRRRAALMALVNDSWPARALRRVPLVHFGAAVVTSLVLFQSLVVTWGAVLPNVLRRVGEGPTLLAMVLSGGVIYFSHSLVLAWLFGAVLFFLIYQRLAYGLALVALWTPFYVTPVEFFWGRHFSMAEIVLLITAAAWALRGLEAWVRAGLPRPRLSVPSLGLADRVWLGLVLMGAVAVTWSVFRVEALRELRVALVEPALFYLMIRARYARPRSSEPPGCPGRGSASPRWDRCREMWLLVDALIASGTWIAVSGLLNYARGSQVVIAEGGTRRLAAIYGSPNNAALFLGACVGLTLGVALVGGVSRLRRVAYGLACAAMFTAAVFTQSAGYLLLGLPVSVAAVLLIWRGRRALPILAVLAVVGLLVLIPLLQLPRFANVTNFSTGTTFIRLMVWRSTWNLIREHPITGVGPDQFLYQYRSRYILPAGWTEPNLSHAHNYFLAHWARLGIVGLALAVGMQVAFWRSASGAYRRLRPAAPALAALAAGLMGAMAHFMGHGLVDTPFFGVDLNYTFALLVGLAVVLARAEVRRV